MKHLIFFVLYALQQFSRSRKKSWINQTRVFSSNFENTFLNNQKKADAKAQV